MDIINPANKKTAALWYSGCDEEKLYRAMNYVIELCVDQVLLLCNTVTAELVMLTSAEYEAYKNLPSVYTPELSELIKHRFVVPVDYHEEKAIETLRHLLSLVNRTGKINSFNILPTTDCNARCFYCYQSDFMHKNMSEKTAYKLVEYIIQNSEGNPVYINWFGGEPTLGVRRIDHICTELKEKGIVFSSSMVSNAYLFNAQLVKKAKELWNLKRIQITLDGTEEIYNKSKAFAGVKGSPFYRVIDNIKKLLEEEIYVTIRLNLDSHNADNLIELINYLTDEIQNKTYLSIYVHELFDGYGFEPITHTYDDLLSLNDKKIEIENLIYRSFSAPKKGRRLPELKYRYCMADDDSYIQCAPDGQLGVCEHYIYDRIIGTLETGITNIEEVEKWKKHDIWEDCKDCPLQPFCLHLEQCPYNSKVCYQSTKNQKIRVVKINMLNLYNKRKQDKIVGEAEESCEIPINC